MKSYELPVLNPSAIPSIALASMNATHREEVELVNRLGALLVQGLHGNVDETAVTAGLNLWLVHTRDHFAAENKLMQEHGFPAYPVHSGEHERVLGELDSVKQRWDEEKSVEDLAQFLFVDWLNWFNQHVNTMDRVTAMFLSQVL